MKSLYYDKAGKPIDVAEWARLSDNHKYKTIARTHVGPKGKGVLVSTIWLGINHAALFPGLAIFETMTFKDGGDAECDCVRYATREEAQRGHAQMVKKVTWGEKA